MEALELACGRPETSLGGPCGSLGALRVSKVLLEGVLGNCFGCQIVPRGLLGDPLRASGPSFGGTWGTLWLPWGDRGSPADTTFGKQVALQKSFFVLHKMVHIGCRRSFWGTLVGSKSGR